MTILCLMHVMRLILMLLLMANADIATMLILLLILRLLLVLRLLLLLISLLMLTVLLMLLLLLLVTLLPELHIKGCHGQLKYSWLFSVALKQYNPTALQCSTPAILLNRPSSLRRMIKLGGTAAAIQHMLH